MNFLLNHTQKTPSKLMGVDGKRRNSVMNEGEVIFKKIPTQLDKRNLLLVPNLI